MSEHSLIIGIVGIIVSATAGGIGFYLGKRESTKQLELFLKALNIERDIKDLENAELFYEDGTVKGKGTVTATFTIGATLIDLKKKKISTKDGFRDMTQEEIEKYGKKSPA